MPSIESVLVGAARDAHAFLQAVAAVLSAKPTDVPMRCVGASTAAVTLALGIERLRPSAEAKRAVSLLHDALVTRREQVVQAAIAAVHRLQDSIAHDAFDLAARSTHWACILALLRLAAHFERLVRAPTVSVATAPSSSVGWLTRPARIAFRALGATWARRAIASPALVESWIWPASAEEAGLAASSIHEVRWIAGLEREFQTMRLGNLVADAALLQPASAAASLALPATTAPPSNLALIRRLFARAALRESHRLTVLLYGTVGGDRVLPSILQRNGPAPSVLPNTAAIAFAAFAAFPASSSTAGVAPGSGSGSGLASLPSFIHLASALPPLPPMPRRLMPRLRLAPAVLFPLAAEQHWAAWALTAGHHFQTLNDEKFVIPGADGEDIDLTDAGAGGAGGAGGAAGAGSASSSSRDPSRGGIPLAAAAPHSLSSAPVLASLRAERTLLRAVRSRLVPSVGFVPPPASFSPPPSAAPSSSLSSSSSSSSYAGHVSSVELRDSLSFILAAADRSAQSVAALASWIATFASVGRHSTSWNAGDPRSQWMKSLSRLWLLQSDARAALDEVQGLFLQVFGLFAARAELWTVHADPGDAAAVASSDGAGAAGAGGGGAGAGMSAVGGGGDGSGPNSARRRRWSAHRHGGGGGGGGGGGAGGGGGGGGGGLSTDAETSKRRLELLAGGGGGAVGTDSRFPTTDGEWGVFSGAVGLAGGSGAAGEGPGSAGSNAFSPVSPDGSVRGRGAPLGGGRGVAPRLSHAAHYDSQRQSARWNGLLADADGPTPQFITLGLASRAGTGAGAGTGSGTGSGSAVAGAGAAGASTSGSGVSSAVARRAAPLPTAPATASRATNDFMVAATVLAEIAGYVGLEATTSAAKSLDTLASWEDVSEHLGSFRWRGRPYNVGLARLINADPRNPSPMPSPADCDARSSPSTATPTAGSSPAASGSLSSSPEDQPWSRALRGWVRSQRMTWRSLYGADVAESTRAGLRMARSLDSLVEAEATRSWIGKALRACGCGDAPLPVAEDLVLHALARHATAVSEAMVLAATTPGGVAAVAEGDADFDTAETRPVLSRRRSGANSAGGSARWSGEDTSATVAATFATEREVARRLLVHLHPHHRHRHRPAATASITGATAIAGTLPTVLPTTLHHGVRLSLTGSLFPYSVWTAGGMWIPTAPVPARPLSRGASSRRSIGGGGGGGGGGVAGNSSGGGAGSGLRHLPVPPLATPALAFVAAESLLPRRVRRIIAALRRLASAAVTLAASEVRLQSVANVWLAESAAAHANILLIEEGRGEGTSCYAPSASATAIADLVPKTSNSLPSAPDADVVDASNVAPAALSGASPSLNGGAGGGAGEDPRRRLDYGEAPPHTTGASASASASASDSEPVRDRLRATASVVARSVRATHPGSVPLPGAARSRFARIAPSAPTPHTPSSVVAEHQAFATLGLSPRLAASSALRIPPTNRVTALARAFLLPIALAASHLRRDLFRETLASATAALPHAILGHAARHGLALPWIGTLQMQADLLYLRLWLLAGCPFHDVKKRELPANTLLLLDLVRLRERHRLAAGLWREPVESSETDAGFRLASTLAGVGAGGAAGVEAGGVGHGATGGSVAAGATRAAGEGGHSHAGMSPSPASLGFRRIASGSYVRPGARSSLATAEVYTGVALEEKLWRFALRTADGVWAARTPVWARVHRALRVLLHRPQLLDAVNRKRHPAGAASAEAAARPRRPKGSQVAPLPPDTRIGPPVGTVLGPTPDATTDLVFSDHDDDDDDERWEEAAGRGAAHPRTQGTGAPSTQAELQRSSGRSRDTEVLLWLSDHAPSGGRGAGSGSGMDFASPSPAARGINGGEGTVAGLELGPTEGLKAESSLRDGGVWWTLRAAPRNAPSDADAAVLAWVEKELAAGRRPWRVSLVGWDALRHM